jgi:hypothetical protein
MGNRISYAEAKRLGLEKYWPSARVEPPGVSPAPARPTSTVAPVPVIESPPGRWTMEVPGWRPVLDNELKRNPLAAHSLKRRDADQIAIAKMVYGVPNATRRRRLTLSITNRFGRFPDDPAPFKSLWDALVTNHLLVDDSRKWLEMVYPPTYERGAKQTVIILEDLEP